jgi:DNA repair protein RadD
MGRLSVTELRDYQRSALERARHLVREQGKRAVLLCMPTGTGKTRTAVEACWGHVQQGGRPLFVAPRRELVQQAQRALRERGLHLAWVRTIQELSRANAEIPPATMVVLDEARHYVADAWSELREKLPNALFLGLDATPERGDGRGLGGMFDALVEAITVKDAIAQGFLVEPVTLRPDRFLDANELAQDPIDAYFEHAPGTSAVVFAPTVNTAIQYTCRFRERGVSAAAVWGEMGEKARDAALEDYACGDVKVLTNAFLLTEGWDSPRTETVILARSFGTAGSYLQAVGRGLRPSPETGKSGCTILDLRGISHEHGDADEPRTWHLDGRAARRPSDDIDVRFCPVCGSPVVGKECETCGHAGEMRHRPPRVLGLPMQRFARVRQDDDDARAARLSKWLRLARSKGWKEGQALHRFKATYGDWPSRALVARARAMG